LSLFEGVAALVSEGRMAAGSCLLAGVDTCTPVAANGCMRNSDILEEIPIPRDGLDHSCGYGGRGDGHEIPSRG
jgi:hypothetical protein